MQAEDAAPATPKLAGRPSTHPEIQEYRRESLIRATIETLARSGIENATVATICAAAGASRGLINHYYSSKEDLLVDAYKHLHDTLLSVTGEAAKLYRGDPRGQLLAIVRAVFDPAHFDLSMRSAYMVFWTASLTNPRYREMNRRQNDELKTNLARLFERASAKNGRTDSGRAALGLLSLVDGLWLEMSITPHDLTPETASAVVLDYVERQLAGDQAG